MKKEENNIKAIIFDIGGVLELGKQQKNQKHIGSKGVHEFVAKKLKISLDQYFDSIDTTYAKSITGKISEKKALETMSKNLNTSIRKLKKFYKKAFKKNFKTNKELYKFAFKLKINNYKIAILSDQWYLSKKTLVKEKYTKKFNSVIISCDTKGLRKPDSKIYKLILKKLKLTSNNCLFIDDREWNIKPAKKLRFQTILYKNNKQLFRQLEKLDVKLK